jgi:hypothetical protein
MTKEDALLYFPYNNEIDIDDLYDELLFEQKQFLSNRMPISKVFNSRIARLKKIDEAFVFFGGKNEAALDELKLLVYDNDSIYESYQVFQKNLNQVRLSIFKASNVTELISTIDVLFKNQIEFARNFPTINQSLEANPIISKEPDAMEIIEAIQSATKIGITKFNELSQLPADNILVQEANRLSLWLKLETHV